MFVCVSIVLKWSPTPCPSPTLYFHLSLNRKTGESRELHTLESKSLLIPFWPLAGNGYTGGGHFCVSQPTAIRDDRRRQLNPAENIEILAFVYIRVVSSNSGCPCDFGVQTTQTIS